jgi:nucleoside-diphosphate-sugar epimerase
LSQPLRILITGGSGFLGKALAQRLLAQDGLALDGGDPRPVGRIILFDPFPVDGLPDDPRLEIQVADIGDRAAVSAAVAGADLIWHLAAVVSAQAEGDFDLGMRVNVDGLLNVLEAARAEPGRPRLVFASSCAIFGGDLPPVVGDSLAPAPKSSYGMQKAIGELLVSDYSRRGFIDGRNIRFPTITVRPGKPNGAASTFASSIIREPLKGEAAVCPVDAATRLFVSSPRAGVEAMVLGMTLSDAAMGADRTVTLPGLNVSVAEMVAALERIAGKATADLIQWTPDPLVQRIVEGWPADAEAAKARRLGFRADADFESIVRAHIEDAGLRVATTA